LDLGALGADRFGGQVSEEKAGIGAIRETDASERGKPKGVPTVDPLESGALRPTMGERGEDENARHEAECPGRQSVLGLE